MKLSKIVYVTFIAHCLLLSGITYADTCYDPNYNQYYNCGEDDYVAPVIAGVLLGVVLSGDGYNGGGGYQGNHGGGHHRGHHGGGHSGKHH